MLPGLSGISGFFSAEPVGITQTYSASAPDFSPANFTSVPLGDNNPDRRIVVLVWHGDTAGSPGTIPTCTVAGTGMTRIFVDTTGDGVSNAVGVAMFVGNPTGTSGTVAVTWAAGIPILVTVLRLIGYSSTPTAFGNEGATGSNGQISISTPVGGCIIALGGSGGNNTNLVWTNITERGDDLVMGINNRRSWAWDTGTSGSAVNSILTPWSASNGDNSMGVASFPLL